MKKIFISVWCVLAWLWGSAYHIVGGEIEFITLEPGRYRINLIQYRDEAQDENNVYLDSYTVYIFSNKEGENEVIRTVTVSLVDIAAVSYTNVECSIDELQTSRVLYSRDIELDPQEFADPEGYYIVWERCCRNAGIKNIVNPEGTGMKYIVDIPPLWKNGKPFINSSPELLKPLSDYACINQLYYTSFTGTDRDGDSLVYKLAVPLNSSTQTEVPIPQPKPNIPVTFKENYSLKNTIPGGPPLRISGRGLLTVSPDSTGLYVFSVIVEEWRKGEKIGQVQRDFQMLAIDGCEPPDPPEVAVKIPGDDDFDTEVDVLRYELEEDKCFDFVVTNLTPGEHISFRVEAVNFDEAIEGLFSVSDTLTGPDMDTIIVQVCAPGCPPVRDGPFIIDLIAGDDACPLPQLDTVRLRIEVEPPPNSFPQLNPLSAGYTINEREVLTLDLEATDMDDDAIVPQLFIQDGTDPAEVGMFLNVHRDEAGLLEAEFVWDTDCQEYDFGVNQHFQVGIRMEDQDICAVENPNITWLDLRVVLPPNTSPEVSIDTEHSVSVSPGQKIDFDVSALDADQDMVHLYLQTDGFSASNAGAKFEPVSGVESVASGFTWKIDCDRLNLADRTDYKFSFIADDDDFCRTENFDTVTFNVHVEVPENFRPEFESYADTVIEVNQPFAMDITAYDPNSGDTLTLEFYSGVRLPDSPSLHFERARGKGAVSSLLEWTPECDLLDFGETSAFFDMAFLVYDDACLQQAFDTISITFEVRETRERFERFEPPNVFTPNGDGKNDTYSLSNLPNPQYNLPLDNCDDAFQYLSIYDRSGKVVFETNNREFVWTGENVAAGTYYYYIKYSRTEYKGFLQVLK